MTIVESLETTINTPVRAEEDTAAQPPPHAIDTEKVPLEGEHPEIPRREDETNQEYWRRAVGTAFDNAGVPKISFPNVWEERSTDH